MPGLHELALLLPLEALPHFPLPGGQISLLVYRSTAWAAGQMLGGSFTHDPVEIAR